MKLEVYHLVHIPSPFLVKFGLWAACRPGPPPVNQCVYRAGCSVAEQALVTYGTTCWVHPGSRETLDTSPQESADWWVPAFLVLGAAFAITYQLLWSQSPVPLSGRLQWALLEESHRQGSTEGHTTCQTHHQGPSHEAKGRTSAVTHCLLLFSPGDRALELFIEKI